MLRCAARAASCAKCCDGSQRVGRLQCAARVAICAVSCPRCKLRERGRAGKRPRLARPLNRTQPGMVDSIARATPALTGPALPESRVPCTRCQVGCTRKRMGEGLWQAPSCDQLPSVTAGKLSNSRRLSCTSRSA
jgi:hypothetical protein